MRRAESISSGSDVVLIVLDCSVPPSPDTLERIETLARSQRVIALSKCDLPPTWSPQTVNLPNAVRTSVRTGEGIVAVREAILAALLGTDRSEDAPRVSNVRHLHLLARTSSALDRAAALARDRAPEEVLLVELTTARTAVEEVSGRRTPDDILAHIFERFCIGK